MVRIIIETDGEGNVLRAATSANDAPDSSFEDAGGPPADLLAALGEADAVSAAMDDASAEDAGGPPPDLGGDSAPAVTFGARVMGGEDDAEDAGGPADWLVAAIEGTGDDDSGAAGEDSGGGAPDEDAGSE